MTTSHATNDARDGRLIDPEALADVFLSHRAGHSDNLLPDGLRRELEQTSEHGMFEVVFIGDPLKIRPNVVGFDAVNVVDLGQIILVWDEGECNQSVNANVSLVRSVTGETSFEIAPVVCIGLHDFGRECLLSAIGANYDAAQTLHGSETADFVQSVEFWDGDGSPFFNESDIHVAGCLSGYGGLAIKDPSRAPTFGGSAIMASGSNTYNRSLHCQ